MMKQVLMFAGIATGALVQQFLPAWPMFGGAKSPVMVAFVVYYALHREERAMWVAVVLAVLLQDGLDPGPFGPALLAFPILGKAANRIRFEIFADGMVTQVIFGALAAMAATLVATLVYALNGERPFHFGYALLRIIGSGLLGMATLPLVSRAVNQLEAALPKRKGYGWQ
ncbi:MAG: rod shape-determining protein MreD [Kiritimatiellales bacterium]|nr:rod shape-determining protein MreD [Kiritimatiellales bacterium]MCF7864870.1 rod shape-determining protein MreD [Kiritimatiellales bacterium]